MNQLHQRQRLRFACAIAEFAGYVTPTEPDVQPVQPAEVRHLASNQLSDLAARKNLNPDHGMRICGEFITCGWMALWVWAGGAGASDFDGGCADGASAAGGAGAAVVPHQVGGAPQQQPEYHLPTAHCPSIGL